MDHDLAAIREWAQNRLDAQQEPPWDSHRCQHLIALIDNMLASAERSARPRRRGNVVSITSRRRRNTAVG
ncbi:MAG TPA: hypothetical protein VK696_10445 [Steroidobacteraceae bacterium]|jgi:hypothetical protein|nr:hypothetical protein [Steroidobacteraceae bacterium]